jgi:hypothetical protein
MPASGRGKMTLKEKREFIESFMETTKKRLLDLAEKSPEAWDGRELRHLIEMVMDQSVSADRYLSKRTARYRSFRSDVYDIW